MNLGFAGIEFEVQKKQVGGSVYTLWSRELLATIELLIGRVGKHLDIPLILEEGADISEFWHGGVYQRQLRKFVSVGGNLEEDILLPLVFFSGAYRACNSGLIRVVCRLVSLVCGMASVSFLDKRPDS